MRRVWLFLALATALASPLATAAEAPACGSRAVFLPEKAVVYDSLRALVRTARKNVLLRIFAISDNDGILFGSPGDQYPMAAEFADLLIARKKQQPALDIVVILDPINFVDYHQAFEFPWQRWAQKVRSWGSLFEGLAKKMEQAIVVNRVYPERYAKLKDKKTVRERLREAGITVLSSNLFGNPENSALFSTKPGRDEPADDEDMRMRAIRRLPSEFGSIGERTALERKLAFYQAYSLCGDHRKFAIADDGTLAWNASMNVWDNDYYSPDDGVVCTGELARELLAQFETARKSSLALYEPLYRAGKMPELAAQFASPGYAYAPATQVTEIEAAGRHIALEPAEGHVLRDGAIAAKLITTLDRLKPGSKVAIYQTLITQPELIHAIAGAARRGVEIRILTESYESVYGHDASFTHGQAFRHFRDAIKEHATLAVKAVVPDPRVSEIHRKFTLVAGTLDTGETIDFLLAGSANFTVHSSDGSELEQDVLFTQGAVKDQARAWFEAAWSNKIETEKNMVPRLIREDWRGKDVLGTGLIVFLSWFGLGG
ncbi:MAG: hypothetical protein HY303_14425 [Candidatus Wallbacteria bacterium]|nr:hypothetical protein [Candidatus Wallbacteria bacterium]